MMILIYYIWKIKGENPMENEQAGVKKPPCSLIRLRAWLLLSMCTQAYLTQECTHVRRGRFLLWVYDIDEKELWNIKVSKLS